MDREHFDFMEMEDHLKDYKVFIHGLRQEQASMYAYLTVINYAALKRAVDESTFTDEQWEQAVEYWEEMSYLSPIVGLLAKWVKEMKQHGGN